MTHEENFKLKLQNMATAAKELNDAWDMIDGNKPVMEKIDIRWPFLERLYYNALRDLYKWATKTADKL